MCKKTIQNIQFDLMVALTVARQAINIARNMNNIYTECKVDHPLWCMYHNTNFILNQHNILTTCHQSILLHSEHYWLGILHHEILSQNFIRTYIPTVWLQTLLLRIELENVREQAFIMYLVEYTIMCNGSVRKL